MKSKLIVFHYRRGEIGLLCGPRDLTRKVRLFCCLILNKVDLIKASFQLRVVRAKPITSTHANTNVSVTRSQWEVEVFACHWRQARENARERLGITFCSLSYRLSKWRKVFLNQSQRVVNQLKPKQSRINESVNFFSQKRPADNWLNTLIVVLKSYRNNAFICFQVILARGKDGICGRVQVDRLWRENTCLGKFWD